MKQNKLALFLSRYDVHETDIEILEWCGLKDINPICYSDKGSMGIIFSHNPKDVIVIWDNRNSSHDVWSVINYEGYKIVNYDDIKQAVKTIIKTQEIFEGNTED